VLLDESAVVSAHVVVLLLEVNLDWTVVVDDESTVLLPYVVLLKVVVSPSCTVVVVVLLGSLPSLLDADVKSVVVVSGGLAIITLPSVVVVVDEVVPSHEHGSLLYMHTDGLCHHLQYESPAVVEQ